jgi:hypothetical protein
MPCARTIKGPEELEGPITAICTEENPEITETFTFKIA